MSWRRTQLSSRDLLWPAWPGGMHRPLRGHLPRTPVHQRAPLSTDAAPRGLHRVLQGDVRVLIEE